MKPLGIKNYGSIPHLSNSKLGEKDYYISSGQERILTEKTRDKHDDIFVFEKYDGSNVGIAKYNNQIFALTRAGYEAKTSPYKQHHLFEKWVITHESIFKEMLCDGERIVGEWMIQATGIIYNISTEPIVFFDYFTKENRRTQYEYLRYKCNSYELNLPRLLHTGDPKKVVELLPILNERTKNINSIELPEGMVYRCERKGEVDFLAKWVRKDFTTGKYLFNDEFTLNNII